GPPGDESRLRVALAAGEANGRGRHTFSGQCSVPWTGKSNLRVRVYPAHRLLTHPHETGLMKWL
ncbi:MAG: hypothetical protein ACREVN_09370, partial [Gammaproteobacteria bacterium]